MKNLKIYDILYIKFIVVISIILIIFSKNIVSDKEKKAIINYNGNEIMALSLNENKKITLKKEKYPLLLDDMEIEIKDNKIAVIKEKSPYNYCSIMGYIKNENQVIICEPNRVIITIENENEKNEDVDIEVR